MNTLGTQLAGDTLELRVWAPRANKVEALLGSDAKPMARQQDGTWLTDIPGRAGSRYQFRLDGGQALPDPYSRFQPDGVHGPSEVIDPSQFQWRNQRPKTTFKELPAIYEMHIGTFTPEGTFDAAAGKLASLRDLGIGAVEVMPVAEFSGARNWGYDGVDWFAPSRNYGRPDSF
ncbi:MAG: malto-oligosyltrehalose trehalohydrolase, partial [Chloroflexi bacterium]|nr:malto-oligosyltrehalose trehalohydrolase [Chloroflexota bacterium]